MLRKSLVVLSILIALFLAGGFLMPANYHVERRVVIEAEPTLIYPHLADLTSWLEWSAHNRERYPECQWSFEGEPSGAGAGMRWVGPKAGTGSLRILQGEPERGIRYNSSFGEESAYYSGGVRLRRQGPSTEVTWWAAGYLGRNPVRRWFGLLLDSSFGPDFEESLAGLKLRVEAARREAAAAAQGD